LYNYKLYFLAIPRLDLIASSFDSSSKEETLEKSSCTCSNLNLSSLKRRPEAAGPDFGSRCMEDNLDSIRTQEVNLDSIRTLEGKRLSFRGAKRF
jgi:hypothetical protein